MANNKTDICPMCKRERVIFYNGMCQSCYKNNNYNNKCKNIKRKHNYNGNSELIKDILEKWINDTRLSAKGVHKDLKDKGIMVSYQYCCRLIKKYGIESEV